MILLNVTVSIISENGGIVRGFWHSPGESANRRCRIGGPGRRRPLSGARSTAPDQRLWFQARKAENAMTTQLMTLRAVRANNTARQCTP